MVVEEEEPVTEIVSGLQGQRVLLPNFYREDIAGFCPKK